jgi:hypothetical protein
MTEINYIGSVETTNFPIHRIQEAHDSWRQVYEGLQLIESHVEAGVRVPPDSNFGGMLGCEWQPRLAELPERLDVQIGAEKLARFFGASVELMQVLARACGHGSLSEFETRDIATWKRETAELTGIRYAGVARW